MIPLPVTHSRQAALVGGLALPPPPPPPPPPVSGDLDAILALMEVRDFEDFTGTTLDANRWRVLGEPGFTQTSPLAPVVQWGDHWGRVSDTDPTPSYIHDPAAVVLQNSILSVGWRYTNSIWRAGGVISATSYNAPRGALFIAPVNGVSEVRFRVPVLPAGFGAFMAAWQMPNVDTFGGWPASGEKTMLDATQHPDGVAVNGSGRNVYTNLPNNWGAGGAPIDFRGNTSVLTNPSVSVLDGQWHVVSQHQYANGNQQILDYYFDGRRYHRIMVPASVAARVLGDWYWLLTAQGMGFWGIGFPPDATLANYYFEVDWVKHWVPAAQWAIAPLDADKVEGNSGSTAFSFAVSRDGGALPAATINYAVSSAVATGADFVGGSLPLGQLSFAADETGKTLTINVAGDTAVEPDEPFDVTISNPSAGVVFVPRAPAIIRTDDAPPPSSRTTAAPVLQSKGLSFLWQDLVGEVGGPADAYGIWGPNTGSRVAWCDFSPSICDRRLDLVTYDNKRCVREVYRANQPIILNSVHGYPATGTRYKEMGLCVDVMFPSDFDATSIDPARPNSSGKTMYGLQCGSPYLHKPGFNTKFSSKGAVCFPPDQWGGELGVNWTYQTSSRAVTFEWYAHIVGVAEGGVNYDRSWANSFSSNPRDGAYSHPPKQYTSWAPRFNVPMGRWFRLELYGRMDTNRQNGLLEIWVDGSLRASWPRLDLGGWRGNRNMGRGTHGPTPPAGNNGDGWSDYDDYCFGFGPLSNDCDPRYRDLGGWGFTWPFMRAMGGGYSLADQFKTARTCYQYGYNWRVYGKDPF